jgi:ribonucleoside-diphosphate reductase alpha chain
MNAPNGTTSIYAGIATGGIEPPFLLEYVRWAIVVENERRALRKKGFTWPDPLKGEWFETEHMKFTIKGDEQILHGTFENIEYEVDKNRGLVKATLVSDYGWEFAKNFYKDAINDMKQQGLFASAMELSVTDHINVLKIVAHYTNMNNSKTVNIPSDYSYEDFKSLYMDAWKSNIKGITTYRAGTMTAVLENKKAKIYQNELERQFAEAGDKIIQNVAKIPNEYFAQGFKIKDNGRKKWYVNMAFVDKELRRPYAIFVSTNNIESSDVTEELIKSMEKLLIEKGLPKKLVEDQILKYESQKNTTRIARIIGMALRHNLKITDVVEVLDKYPHELSSFVFHLSKLLARYIQDGTKVKKEKCPSCKSSTIVYQDGCKTCITCGWSKC